jgi:transcriptional regulator with XRE-family HTH domain
MPKPCEFMAKILQRRKDFCISITTFADMCGIDLIRYSKLEHGYAKPKEHERMAMKEVLQIEIEKILKSNRESRLL